MRARETRRFSANGYFARGGYENRRFSATVIFASGGYESKRFSATVIFAVMKASPFFRSGYLELFLARDRLTKPALFP